MKKVWMIGLSIFLTIIAWNVPSADASKAEPLKIEVNDAVVPTPVGVHIVQGEVMIPIRWAAEQLGVQSIKWDSDTRTVLMKTDESIDQYMKLSSYINGLTLRSEEKEAERLPLTESAKKIVLPTLPNRVLTLNLEGQDRSSGTKKPITFSVNDDPYAVNDFEMYDDRIYVLADWLQQLFKAEVTYDQQNHKLSIRSFNREEIETCLHMIEEALISSTPEDTVKLWGRGEQTRSGALQYAALSPELKKAAMEQNQSSWVTGMSSPWIGQITIAKEIKHSDQAVEYTITYPEITSAGSTIGSETFLVEKLFINGKEGWYITRHLSGSSYSILSDIF
ncbi:stalk domain-containing protein [Bacillus chungangensis]|uniref:Copper amine oxidase-like N-terminal domain-containing protein n=1 Tax=Bacillus chungangensis TaxID=587633 RepID=A0ABT9WQH5_9BACI|nr:stalk domain-containing protein [Bacillus chungangensis]MDQ0175538.1 hypothetical protein [Bacillus chungangensis]